MSTYTVTHPDVTDAITIAGVSSREEARGIAAEQFAAELGVPVEVAASVAEVWPDA